MLLFLKRLKNFLLSNVPYIQQNQSFEEMLQGLLSHSVPEVSVSEVEKMTDVVLLDARTDEEYQVSHIKGARWIGGSDFKVNLLADLPKNKAIVVYCSVGYRSEKITKKLQKEGYTNVSNFYGGIFSWKNEGGTVVNPQNQVTEKVHTYNKKWSQWLLKGEKVW